MMTEAESLHVVHTTDGLVWLADADSPDEAVQVVKDQYPSSPDEVYYEGKLDSTVREATRDGAAVLNQ